MRPRHALVLLFAAACAGRGAAPPEAARELAWTPASAPAEPVVARVGGVPLSATELGAHVRATGLAPRAALEDLVRQELLAQEARRRGLADAPDVRLARRQALVRRFVSQEFGRATAAPESIPESDARPLYEAMHEYFDHGRMLRVLNVCTTEERARALYAEARAHPVRSADEWKTLAEKMGATAQEVLSEETSRGYHAAWRKGVFAALKRAGDVMAPLALPDLPLPCTTHVAYCEEVIAPRHDSLAQALPEIRRRIHEDWRRKSFLAWVGRLVRQHAVDLHPEALPGEPPREAGP